MPPKKNTKKPKAKRTEFKPAVLEKNNDFRRTSINMVKNPVFARRFYNGGNYSKQTVFKKVEQFTRDMAKELAEQSKTNESDWRFMVSSASEYGWNSGKGFNGGDDVILDEYDWQYAYEFVVYVWKWGSNPLPALGDSKHNDCILECIRDETFNRIKPSNDVIKKNLGLKRDDKIPYNKIAELEKLIDTNINIKGNPCYTSSGKYKYTVYMNGANGHAFYGNSRDYASTLLKLKLPKHKTKLCLVINNEDGSLCLYDGETKQNVDAIDKLDEYAYVNTAIPDDMTIEELHAKYIQDNYDLMLATDGRIDMAWYNWNCKVAVNCMLHHEFKTLPQPDKCDILEQTWIKNASMGGLMYSQGIMEIEEAHEYDRTSFYPSLMCNNSFTFPIKKGIFTEINKVLDIMTYGIYRCVITPSNDVHIDKLFRFNKLHYYTHFDIESARNLGLEITMITDGQANALLYNREGRAHSPTYFKPMIEQLFNLKQSNKSNIFAKQLLNLQWGMLSQKNMYYHNTTEGVLNLQDNHEIEGIHPIDNQGNDQVKYTDVLKNIYKYDYCRLGTFLVSAQRRYMSKVMYLHRENIVRFHTDGFICTHEIPELSNKNSDDLSESWTHKSGKCMLNYVNRKVEWGDLKKMI